MEYTETINGENIQDWESFHNEFQEKLGFFKEYGRNLNAWIDCMSDLYTNGEYESLTKFNLNDGDKLTLQVQGVEKWKKESPETFDAFIDCCISANAERTNFHLVLR